MKTKSSSSFILHPSSFVLLLASTLFLTPWLAPAETVAYWRFEEGPADAQVPHGGQADGVFYPGVNDGSGNGNALSVWAENWAGYAYRTDVSSATVPLTGAGNHFSVQNTGEYPTMFTETGANIQFMEPAAFTIEASFKPQAGGWRTLVGRDSHGAYAGDPNLAALYLQITPDNAVAIKFCDFSGYWHQAISANGIIAGFPPTNSAAGHWYHIAAVSDGSTLSLYLDSGFGCRLVAQTDLTLSGSPYTALTAGTGDGGDWDAGNWSVGRGLYAGGHTDRAFGFIDEVRISDTALATPEFLFWRPPLPLQVFSTNDSGYGSLRAALASAADGDTITFSNSLSGTTILLTSGQLLLNKSVNIDGSALANGITIDGNANGRIFEVPGGNTVVLDSLTVAHGEADDGGGIYNAGNLAVNRCTLSGNAARTNGGGILNLGTLTVDRCTLVENAAGNWGGGIINMNYGSTLTVNQCTFTANGCAGEGGAGIDIEDGVATVNQSTLTGNSATDPSGAGGVFVIIGSVTIDNSIVAGNTAPNINTGGGLILLTGNNLTAGAPLLAPLGNYGGSTPTMLPLPGSPALDGCTSGTSFATDQRALPRIVGPFADLGAVEAGNVVVNTAADENDGPGTNGVSLRDAIAYAPSGSVITFAPALSGATIVLTNGQLDVPSSVSILGPGPGLLTVSGNNTSRVFNVTGTNVIISGLTIADGYSDLNGAGIYAAGSPGSVIAISDCVITNNYASQSGGGLCSSPDVAMTISNCTISGNTAAGVWGGGIYNNRANLAVVGSTLSGNSGAIGGGIASDGGSGGNATLSINASTVSSNSSYLGGGGIINWGENGSAALTINATTFSGNSATGSGGGAIFNNGGGGTGTVQIANTILNAGAKGANIYNYEGTVTSQGYNLSSDDASGFLTDATDQVNTDPRLGPLQDNGGPTWTHALLPGSPAIDRGKTNAIPALASVTDQRGLARLVDNPSLANADGGDGSDIGGYELQPQEPTVAWLNTDDGFGTSSFNGTTNWSDGLPPSAGKNYFNANFLLRTPADGNGYVFGGDSLTITSDAAPGAEWNDALMYKGTASSTITVSNLTINGGFLRHANSEAQTFTLAGNLTVGPSGMAVAVQGPLNITAAVLGSGPIKIMANGSADAARTVEFDSASNTYNGSIELVHATQSRFRLADAAVLNFVLGASDVNNRIFATPGTGGGVITLDGAFEFDLAGASTNLNDTWQIVDVAGLTEAWGTSFAVNGFCPYPDNTWSKAANGTIYAFNPSDGTLKVTGFRAGYDADADGLPDDWELVCFGNLSQAATDDLDGDGQDNFFEYMVVTNPTNAASVFVMRAGTVAGQPSQMSLVFSPWAASRTYTPEFTTNLAQTAFFPLTGYTVTTNGTEVSVNDQDATEGQKFYRIEISMP